MKASAPGMPSGGARSLLHLVLLVVPWLLPFAGGPSPAVQPWLASAACAAAVALLQPHLKVSGFLWLCAAALGLFAVLHVGVTLDTLALLGGLYVVCLMAACAKAAGEVTIARSWLGAALLSTVLALAQYFGVADWLGGLASASSNAEAYANLRQRNQFATLTAVGLCALQWYVARRGLGWPTLLAAVALAVGNAATTSRTGLLELLLLAALAFAWRGPGRGDAARLALAALLAYVIGAFALPWLQSLAGVGATSSLWDRVAGVSECSSRGVLWTNVLQLIAQRPLLGWGWGELDYAHFATLYPGDRFCDILDNAHNLPLHLAAELGLPVALLVCGGSAWAVWRARPWAEQEPGRRMALSVLLVLAAHSLLEYPLWYGPFQIALGLGIGMLWTTSSFEAGNARARSWPRLLLPALLGVAVAYAAWDYRRVGQIYLSPEDRLPQYRDDTLGAIRQSRIFSAQARFAALTLADLTPANAQWNLRESQALLHYSPEPKLIERVIESATLLGRDDEAVWYLARYRAAFPQAHAEWARRLREPQGAR